MVDHDDKSLSILIECALPVVLLLVLVIQVKDCLPLLGSRLEHRRDVPLVDTAILLRSRSLDALVSLERVGESGMRASESIEGEAVARGAAGGHPLTAPLLGHGEDERYRHLLLLGLLPCLLKKRFAVALLSAFRVNQVLHIARREGALALLEGYARHVERNGLHGCDPVEVALGRVDVCLLIARVVADIAKEARHRLVRFRAILNVGEDTIIEEEAVMIVCRYRLEGHAALDAEVARDGERAIAHVVLLVQPREDGVELLRDILRVSTHAEVAAQINGILTVGEADFLLIAIEDEHDEALAQEVLSDGLVAGLGVVSRDEGADTRNHEALSQLWLLQDVLDVVKRVA